MLGECLEIFERELAAESDGIILNDYVPAEGTYLLVNEQGELETFMEVKIDKKSRRVDRSHSYFMKFCFWDYHSRLIETRKPMDAKKIIHSNNYLSFFIRMESLDSGKLTDAVIDGYYETLGAPEQKYKNSKNTLEIYHEFEEKNGPPNREAIEKNREWIREHIFRLSELGIGMKGMKGKDYIKIFFRAGEDEYIREHGRYLFSNIYNKNEYNIKKDGEILGLPNDNLGMNAKKPYLSMKTRKLSAPYYLNSHDVLIQRKFFDYLMNFAASGLYHVFLDYDRGRFFANRDGEVPETSFSGLYLRIQKEKNEAEIRYQDVIPSYHYQLKKELVYRNILALSAGKGKDEWKEETCKNKKQVQGLINEVFFAKYLTGNYFTKPEEINLNDGYLKNALLLSREAIFNWIYKEEPVQAGAVLEAVSLGLVKGSLREGFEKKAAKQFNLRWSLIEYFKGGTAMADKLKETADVLRIKVNGEKSSSIESDGEYFFAVGQLVRYFISLSKTKKKTHSLANPFFNARDDVFIKMRLKQFFVKYNYCINISSKRFNHLYEMVVGYETEGAVEPDMLIGGYLYNSLIYEKEEVK